MAAVTVENVDALLGRLDTAYQGVLAARGSSVKLPSAELNFLSVLGSVRDVFAATLRTGKRELLQELFGGSCKRVAHVRAILDVLELSPMNASDQRLRGCLNACLSVKEVLVDMGLADALERAEEQEKEALTHHESKDSLGEAKPEEVPTAEAPAEDAAPAADDLCAGMDVRPPLGGVVEEEWAELMGVRTCKVGCGRRNAPGVTRSGNFFDTCCRGCALGRAHHKLCGLIDPSKVGRGLCKAGCGRRVAEGTDSLGLKRDTCCRGCAHGDGHDEKCSSAAAAEGGDTKSSVIVVHDERSFFSEVKSTLNLVQFNQFLECCRLQNKEKQTLEQTLEKVRSIFGKENDALIADFERLVTERMRELGRA